MKTSPLASILWIFAAIFVGLWLLGLALKILGILVGLALILVKYALIAAIIVVVFNYITSRLQR